MKKLLLASAVAALSVSAAQAAPTVYGKAFLTVDAGNTETTTKGSVQSKNDVNTTGINSNGSRIGLRGSEALTANTDVVYQLEYGVDIDNANNNGRGQFYSRDTYMGLANKQYGTVLAGRLTTIDDRITYADHLEGSNPADIGPTFSAPRANNAVAYVSPDFNGVQVLGMYALDSDRDAGGLANTDQYGVAVRYAAGPMHAGASYIGYGKNNHVRLSGDYAISPALTVAAMYQFSKFDRQNSSKENTLRVTGEMATATPWTAYAQATFIDNVNGNSNDESFGIGVGGKYAFNQATTGHVYGGYVDTENRNVVVNGVSGNTQSTSGFGIGAGLEYRF